MFHANQISLAFLLGWSDILSKYRRSVIGPFWITISMGVMIACVGLVFGGLFNTPIENFLPFLTTGLLLWAFFAGTINEGCLSFINAEGIIKQLPIPLSVHVFRVVWRNLLMLAHNIIILPIVLLITGTIISPDTLLVLPAITLILLFLSSLVFIVATACLRYRDLPQIVANVLQVAFYLTPIIWMPELLPERLGAVILDWNPFYHMLELLRAPLLGSAPAMMNWLVVGAITILGWGLTLLMLARVKHRIAYWL